MTVNAEHPDYCNLKQDWKECRDSFKGERHVKELGREYLPPTVSMVMDGMMSKDQPGSIAYEAYKLRARFPDFMQVGVETLVGILNAKPYEIELPDGMEYLLENATNKKEKMGALIRRIHSEQCTVGRVGLLVDLPKAPDPLKPQPYIALYKGEHVINWDDSDDNEGNNKLNMVTLDESGNTRVANQLDWQLTYKYRVLGLMGNVYMSAVFEGQSPEFLPGMMTAPMLRGKTLSVIPFVFINSKDNLSAPDIPPLSGLARLCMSIYRSEADYRQALFLQGQDTLVVIGGMVGTNGEEDKPTRIGAGSKINVNIGGDAKFIGMNSQGIPEMRTALENDNKAASVRTGQLLAPGKMSMESGEALKTRVAAQTATLTSVALSCAAGLEQALRHIAVWLGKDPSKVKVKPNLDFTNVEIQGQDVVQLITAKSLGFPLSARTLHRIAFERGLTKKTFEEEMSEIEGDKQEQVLKKWAEDMAAKLKGNNDLEAAGGDKKKPANDKTGASNAQK